LCNNRTRLDRLTKNEHYRSFSRGFSDEEGKVVDIVTCSFSSTLSLETVDSNEKTKRHNTFTLLALFNTMIFRETKLFN
jgi:hypothetical protein